MNAPQYPAQFVRRLPTVAALDQTVEDTRAAAARPEPLWQSVLITLAVVFVIVLLVMI